MPAYDPTSPDRWTWEESGHAPDILGALAYIAASPPWECGGFHPETVEFAKQALGEIVRLRTATGGKPMPVADYLDLAALEQFLARGCMIYQLTAPTVERYLDDLYVRIHDSPQSVTLRELMRVRQLHANDWLPPNYAANLVYKLQTELGQDTTGQAGF